MKSLPMLLSSAMMGAAAQGPKGGAAVLSRNKMVTKIPKASLLPRLAKRRSKHKSLTKTTDHGLKEETGTEKSAVASGLEKSDEDDVLKRDGKLTNTKTDNVTDAMIQQKDIVVAADQAKGLQQTEEARELIEAKYDEGWDVGSGSRYWSPGSWDDWVRSSWGNDHWGASSEWGGSGPGGPESSSWGADDSDGHWTDESWDDWVRSSWGDDDWGASSEWGGSGLGGPESSSWRWGADNSNGHWKDDGWAVRPGWGHERQGVHGKVSKKGKTGKNKSGKGSVGWHSADAGRWDGGLGWSGKPSGLSGGYHRSPESYVGWHSADAGRWDGGLGWSGKPSGLPDGYHRSPESYVGWHSADAGRWDGGLGWSMSGRAVGRDVSRRSVWPVDSGCHCFDEATVTITNLSSRQSFSEIFIMTASAETTKRQPIFTLGNRANKALSNMAQKATASDMLQTYRHSQGVEQAKIIARFPDGKTENKWLKGGGELSARVRVSEMGRWLSIAAGLPFTNDGAVILQGEPICHGAEYWIPAYDVGAEGNIQTCYSVAAKQADFPSNSQCAKMGQGSDENENDFGGENFVSVHHGFQEFRRKDERNALLTTTCSVVRAEVKPFDEMLSFATYFHFVGYREDSLMCESRSLDDDTCQFVDNKEFKLRLQSFPDQDFLLQLALRATNFRDFCGKINRQNRSIIDRGGKAAMEPEMFQFTEPIAHVRISCPHGDLASQHERSPNVPSGSGGFKKSVSWGRSPSPPSTPSPPTNPSPPHPPPVHPPTPNNVNIDLGGVNIDLGGLNSWSGSSNRGWTSWGGNSLSSWNHNSLSSWNHQENHYNGWGGGSWNGWQKPDWGGRWGPSGNDHGRGGGSWGGTQKPAVKPSQPLGWGHKGNGWKSNDNSHDHGWGGGSWNGWQKPSVEPSFEPSNPETNCSCPEPSPEPTPEPPSCVGQFEEYDLCIALDMSGSVEEFDKIKNFARGVVEETNTNPDIKYSVVTFGKDAKIENSPSTAAEAKKKVDELTHVNGGGTNLQAAIQKCQESLTDSTAKKYMVIVTDGVPTLPKDPNSSSQDDHKVYAEEQARQAAQNAKNKGFTIIPVFVQNTDNEDDVKDAETFLGEISSDSVILADNFSQLDNKLPELGQQLQCDTQCVDQNEKFGLCIAIDTSKSVEESQFDGIKNFAKDILEETRNSNAKYSVVRFDKDANQEIGPSSAPNANFAIDALDYSGGDGTNLQAAIKKCQESLKDDTLGKKFMVVITGGEPTLPKKTGSNNHAKEEARRTAQLAKRDGFAIIPVFVDEDAGSAKTFLKDISSDRDVLVANGTSGLKDKLSQLGQKIRCNTCVNKFKTFGLCIALEWSDSVDESDFTKMGNFAKSIVERTEITNPNAEYTVVTFGKEAIIRNGPSNAMEAKEILGKVSEFEKGNDGTYLQDAIQKCQESLTDNTAKKYMVVITDGVPTLPEDNAEDEAKDAAQLAKKDGFTIIPVLVEQTDVDPSPAKTLLNKISSDGEALVANGFDKLQDELSKLVQNVQCASCVDESEKFGICIAIDDTAAGNFDLRTEFATSIVDKTKRNPNAKYSVVLFSTDADQVNGQSSAQIAKFAIGSLKKSTNGGRNLEAGIKKCQDSFATDTVGKKFMVVLTDAGPTLPDDAPTGEQKSEAAARLAEKDGFTIIPILMGQAGTAETFLKKISSDGDVIAVNERDQLPDNEAKFVEKVECDKQCADEAEEFSICIALDMSKSVEDENKGGKQGNFNIIKIFAKSFVDETKMINPNAKYSVVTFSTDANIVTDPNPTDAEKANTAIDGLDYDGGDGTILEKALQRCQESLTGNTAKFMILITDGVPTLPKDPNSNRQDDHKIHAKEKARQAAQNAKNKGFTIIPVFVQQTDDQAANTAATFLKEISSDGSVIVADGVENLNDKLSKLVKGVKCDTPCIDNIEEFALCIALDMSKSVEEGNFKMKDFAKDFVDEMRRNPNGKYSVVSFGTKTAQIVTGPSTAQVANFAIGGLEYVEEGGKNLQDAIKKCRESLDNTEGKQYLIAITDGEPTLPANDPKALARTAAQNAKNNGFTIVSVFLQQPDDPAADAAKTFFKKDISSGGSEIVADGAENLTGMLPKLVEGVKCDAPCVKEKDKFGLCIALDMSTSVEKESQGGQQGNFDIIKGFAKRLVVATNTNPAIKYSIVSFGINAKEETNAPSTAQRAMTTIDGLRYGDENGTNLQGAIKVCQKSLRGVNAQKKFQVIITDGVPTLPKDPNSNRQDDHKIYAKEKALQAVQIADLDGFTIIPVFVHQRNNQAANTAGTFLKKISSDGSVIVANGADNLNDKLSELDQEIKCE